MIRLPVVRSAPKPDGGLGRPWARTRLSRRKKRLGAIRLKARQPTPSAIGYPQAAYEVGARGSGSSLVGLGRGVGALGASAGNNADDRYSRWMRCRKL